MSNKIYPERGMPPVDQAKGPAIVLVNPQMGENIGAAARAMLNCGLTDLRLVAPRDGWPNEAARINSSGALDVIERAQLFDTLADAVADCTFVVGTTSRDRDMTKPILLPDLAVQAIIQADATKQAPTSALVFGPERTGLVNEDITCCDALLTIPLNPNYASLNIAQAVLLVVYQWRTAAVTTEMPDILHLSDTKTASKAEIENVLLHLTDALDESGFFATKTQKPAMVQNLRNMFQRMRLTAQEAQTFHGVIKALRGKEWKK
jgi:tRNA/rRNA methyltransferase